MNDDTRPTNLAGMFIGGAVPFELAGQIFRAFYAAGIDPRSFELAPIYNEAQVGTAIDELRGKLGKPNGVPQITDQSAPKKRRNRKPIVAGSFKAFLLDLITKAPRTRIELRKLAAGKSWTIKSLDARLYDLLKMKMIVRSSDGAYLPNSTIDSVAIAALQKQQGGKTRRRVTNKGRTNEELILNLLKKAFPNTVTLAKLRAKFKTKGLRAESASVALHVLKTRGQVERPEPAVYKYVEPQPQQETSSNV